MNPSDDQLIRAFDQAPSIIQESLSGGSAVDFMASLPTRYGLHVDTVGYVSEYIRNMLLGFLRPEQFMGELESIGIDNDRARQLVTDLNKEVFIPLRDKIRKGAGGVVPQHPSSIPHVPVMTVSRPNVEPTVPESVQSPAHTPAEPPAFNLIRPETAPQPQPAAPTPPVPYQVTPTPTMRTMQHDLEALQHGVVPEPYPVSALSTTRASQMTPAREFQTASVPFTSMPVASRPVESTAPISVPAQPIQTVPPVTPDVEPISAAEYSSDPYREPI